MRTLFHGSRMEVEYPEIRVQKFHKDFRGNGSDGET